MLFDCVCDRTERNSVYRGVHHAELQKKCPKKTGAVIDKSPQAKKHRRVPSV